MQRGQTSTDSHIDPQGVIQPFDYDGVRLRPSRLLDQYEQTRDYFFALPNDDLLKGFRERAGLPSPGKHLLGWYSGDDKGMFYSEGDFGHAFGQWLSAFARMAKATGDEAVRDKAVTLMDEWAKAIAPDGYSYASNPPHSTEYIYDKMCGGLVDMAVYAGCAEALDHLETITTWSLAHLDPALRKSEWYTLSENLYRAYEVTGDATYRDFAQRWHYTSMWEGLAQGQDTFVGHHAYSHVNTLGSAAMAFAVTGERHYFDAIDNAYRILHNHHLFATGGYGPKERFFPPEGWMGEVLIGGLNWLAYPSSFETPCGSWAAFKLCRYLMSFTGAARYGDWIERLVYNGIGAALPMAGRGETFYYSDYRMVGGSKFYHAELWPCCSGTYPIAVADYHNLIYFKDALGIYVNLFIPSEVTWSKDGVEVHVIQETDFPETGQSDLTVRTASPVEFALRFRVPGWVSGGVSIRANGEALAVTATPGQWAEVRRVWQDGDRLSISLPMQLVFAPVDEQHSRLMALTIGPVVLVADRGPRWPWEEKLTGDPTDPSSWIVPTGRPLTFRAENGAAGRTFRPFYELGEDEVYWMYMEVHDA